MAVTAGLFSLTVELSQLYHAPWIDELRQIRLAALLLGQGFLWSRPLPAEEAGAWIGHREAAPTPMSS